MIYHRLSIVGNLCVHCDTEITESLRCQGCGWMDPATKSKPQPEPNDPTLTDLIAALERAVERGVENCDGMYVSYRMRQGEMVITRIRVGMHDFIRHPEAGEKTLREVDHYTVSSPIPAAIKEVESWNSEIKQTEGE